MQKRVISASLALIVFCVGLLIGCESPTALQDAPTLVPGSESLPPTRTLTPTVDNLNPGRTPSERASGRSNSSRATHDGFQTIDTGRLPQEALETLRLIGNGGPFPYRQDGVVFQNREGYLPAEPDAYYREYTVKTPGSPDRGARRIIAGKGGELYYTDDHYVTFWRIVQ